MDDIITGLIVASGAALINFVSTKIYSSVTGNRKNFLWTDQNAGLKSLPSILEFEELKKRTRIVVIDDEEAFPVKLFLAEGYSVEKWDKVENYGKLERGFYDIIVLDIKGVADHISEEDGLGVLESLKKNNPAQIIIAYSQHSFDLSKSKFWELADEKIAKPSDFLKIKKSIDNLIKTQFKPERYIASLHNLFKHYNLSNKEMINLETTINKLIKEKKQPDRDSFLKSTNYNNELVSKIISLTNIILKFF